MSANLKLQIKLISNDEFQLKITNSMSLLPKKKEKEIRLWLHLKITEMLKSIDPNLTIEGSK